MNNITEYLKIVDHIQGNGEKPVILEPTDYSVPRPPVPTCTLVDGKITAITLTQSFIKQIMWTGPATQYVGSWDLRPDACAFQVYNVNILHKYKFPTSQAQLSGQYFETQAIGAGAYGSTHYLPRNTRTGQPKVGEERILEAVKLFKQVAEQTGILIDKRNTQVVKTIPILDSEFEDIQVSIKCVADIISPFKYENIDYDLAVVDLKLSADRNSEFFKTREPWLSFCWGNPEKMSSLQGTVYSTVFEIPFLNLIFDYKKNDPGFKVVPVKTIMSHPDDQEARLRHKEMKQGVKKAISQLVEWSEWDWPTNPGLHCTKCPVSSCPAKKTIEYF